MVHVVVIGAGVIGLSTAVLLQKNGNHVTIVAKDFPSPSETVDDKNSINYASHWGGAHNRWVIPSNDIEQRDHAMALETYDAMQTLSTRHPEAGITFMKGIEYLDRPCEQHLSLDEEKARTLGIRDFRLLGADEFPDKDTRWGCEYSIWCVSPMVYCSFLLRRFTLDGGKLLHRELGDPAEIFKMNQFSEVRSVVNSSGSGFNDPNCFIIRGQTCLVADNVEETVTRQNADGTWTFCIPRGFDSGTVIGGTKEPNNWDPEARPNIREKLLNDIAATHPVILKGKSEFRVLKDIVGRRPARRGGMKLEMESLGPDQAIVHAYGLGGRGFELSWGVANHVVKLLE